jgi:hypothetical protein
MRMAHPGWPEWVFKWVFKRITYFDHETHRFRTGDIEIDGEWISAIRAPGTSTIEYAVDGRGYACTPGLIHAQVDSGTVLSQSARLLESGTTTAGIVCATAGECIRAAARSHVRLIAHLLLNAFSAARVHQSNYAGLTHAAEIGFFQRTAAVLKHSSARLLPALHCSSIVSAQELVYAQNVAGALHRKLCLLLSDSVSAAQSFRERFYCSETQLLEFMRLLQCDTSIWRLSQLTRIDVDILRRSNAEILDLNWRATAGFQEPRPRSLFPANFHCPFPACEAEADAAVDAATVAAASALGDPTCGQIAPGMRADLCLFATANGELCGLGSNAFIDLFERRGPSLVLIGGRKAHDRPTAFVSRNALPMGESARTAGQNITAPL